MFENVVVGVTESAAAAAAIDQAMDLAGSTGAMLHMVSALPAHPAELPPLPDELRYSIGPVDPVDRLLSQLETRARAASVRVTTHAVLASPVEALTKVAAREHADLIVVGADSAHSGRHRGMVPDALMRAADCAVLVVEPDGTS